MQDCEPSQTAPQEFPGTSTALVGVRVWSRPARISPISALALPALCKIPSRAFHTSSRPSPVFLTSVSAINRTYYQAVRRQINFNMRDSRPLEKVLDGPLCGDEEVCQCDSAVPFTSEFSRPRGPIQPYFLPLTLKTSVWDSRFRSSPEPSRRLMGGSRS